MRFLREPIGTRETVHLLACVIPGADPARITYLGQQVVSVMKQGTILFYDVLQLLLDSDLGPQFVGLGPIRGRMAGCKTLCSRI